MKWIEFHPYVLPYVIGCPDPVVEHHARLAAIEFCRRTGCFKRSLDAVKSDGLHILELEPDTGTSINKVHAVSVGEQEVPLVDSKSGLTMARSSSPSYFCFTQDGCTLTIYPAPLAGDEVVADVTLTPTLTASTLDDDVAREYMQDMAIGAIASIQRIPGQVFSDLNGSMLMRQQFEARMATVAAKVSRGLLGAKMRSRTSYL